MNKSLTYICSLLIALLSLECYGQKKILVAAASDLKFALDSVAAVFRKKNSGTVEITYGSSGKLFEQISNGGPFDIFFSADIEYPKKLKEKGLAASDIYIYGVGRIVVWSRKIEVEKEGMNSLLSPGVKKIAIANPLHAPYGKRAKEALKFYKMHDALKTKLVLGENISQTAQFVTTGAADIGIVAYSLALSPNMKKENGKFYLIPEDAHQRLEQAVVITKQGKANDFAQTFLSFVKSNEAKQVLSYFGFK
ncbi:MAG TPA: molybdate ABC transporter substrate-binding protein [Chryseolinea sp.]|nr:molybdate ABC transporter substrate-binding protein [Chryseolinea sp.]